MWKATGQKLTGQTMFTGFGDPTHTGNGSDGPDFDPLLYQNWRRANVKTVVADAGHDSEKNHRIARLDMRVRSIISRIGRPTSKPPRARYRRLLARHVPRARTDQVGLRG